MSNIIDFKGAAARPRVAVIGSGISGLAAAWRLSSTHEVSLFEKNARIGGHSHTVEVDCEDGRYPVDTGFIVYNEANYPNLTGLFAELEVPTIDSDMSFAASLNDGQFEYSGSGLSGLFAQKRNILRPRMWQMISDLLRLYREGPGDAQAMASQDGDMSLDDYLLTKGYSGAFREDHILPMCAAIWSSPVETIAQFPARSFLTFFENHGLMRLKDRPSWRTVEGGSREYVKRILRALPGRVVTNAGIRFVRRGADGVQIQFEDGRTEQFDSVVFACHSEEALALLETPTMDEQELLGAISYQENTVYLHRDTSFMPKRQSVWSSWNYISQDGSPTTSPRVSLTYWMNKLQQIKSKTPILVTLNPTTPPDASKTYRHLSYTHPVFDRKATLAQRSLWKLQGAQNTWFCGAYWGFGFHEDGVQSGLAVAEAMGAPERPWAAGARMDRLHWPTHPTLGERDALALQSAAE